KDYFNKFEPFFDHSHMTAGIARDVAEKLGLNPEEAHIAGMLHDVGKCFTADKKTRTFHEIVGARYIAERGLSWGISDSQEQCYKLAQIARSHFIVYEQFQLAKEGEPSHQPWLPGLEDTNPELLLPNTWNEFILIYADMMRNMGLKEVSLEYRLADIEERDRKTCNPRLLAIEKAKPSLLQIKEDIESAIQESLNKKVDLSKHPLL
ncbi:MAG: HD domain-containing protein, partial [Nanoarchaeota archaeon]